jgi:hypothetical protein
MRRHSLLRLYPSHWRQRYEEEVGALVDAAPLSVGLVVDLLRGAFEAHIHPELGAPSLLGSTGSGQIPLAPPSPANRLALLTVLIVMLVATSAVGYYLGRSPSCESAFDCAAPASFQVFFWVFQSETGTTRWVPVVCGPSRVGAYVMFYLDTSLDTRLCHLMRSGER